MQRGVHASGHVKAVLGPTNTGKTHLAVERLCAHSSGIIGFPLRLLAREVYDRVVAIKGIEHVALITGEERIEPAGARWRLCTAEAMDRDADVAFLAIDEGQLGVDRERGHVFTDRILNARGREETMILGSSTLTPMIEKLVPEAEIVSRPRFSELGYAGSVKFSRLPPRSAVVAFSAEQVYAVAEMLRRFRGGAAVVMGALSPQTRNAQVELFQSGEVDYIVATDAIGMGLNLDVHHVAFAALSKFDGRNRRRLTVPEMAQVAGRAGRHQRDGTFGTLSGASVAFSEQEIRAIEDHRFAPVEHLFWRDARPRTDSLAMLIADLAAPPDEPFLRPAPEAIDLAVARTLSADPAIAESVQGPNSVARFWEVCSLPDFRQLGAEHHARFVARLWQDLGQGAGRVAHDYTARKIAELDNPAGDIDTLQGRIAAIRTWAYVAQRPDWVADPADMAERARRVEARLSDALHNRLTERFVNRRTSVLVRKLGSDSGLLPVALDEADRVLVDGEEIGHLDGFAFRVDPRARLETRRLLLAAAEKHLPVLLAQRAKNLLRACSEAPSELRWEDGGIIWNGSTVAMLRPGPSPLAPRLSFDPAFAALTSSQREPIAAALQAWLDQNVAQTLKPLMKLSHAAEDLAAGPELRAMLIAIVEGGGFLARDRSGLERLDAEQRNRLRKLGVKIGAIDLFVPVIVRAQALRTWVRLAHVADLRSPPFGGEMVAVRPASGQRPIGYRRIGNQDVRIDMAERLLHAAHQRRERWAGTVPRRRRRQQTSRFVLDPTMALSMGLTTHTYAMLLNRAGFIVMPPAELPEGAYGPPGPPGWHWRPRHRKPPPHRDQPKAGPRIPLGNPFGVLAELLS